MKHLKITSPSNPHIKEVLTILKEKPAGGERSFLVEGVHLVEMALSSGAAIKEVFVTNQFSLRPEGVIILGQLDSTCPDIRCLEVVDQIFRKLTETETPQGIAALIQMKSVSLEDLNLSRNPIMVVLDRIQDPGNLGTIIRTADAAGAEAVVLLPGSCDAFNHKTIRSTAGSIFSIPVVQSGLGKLLSFTKTSEIKLLVTAADAGPELYETDLSGPIALVFGNESQGVSNDMREAASGTFSIPIRGGAESLNVSSAAAVCLFEALRQRSQGLSPRSNPMS